MARFLSGILIVAFLSLQPVAGGSDENSYFAARRETLMKKIGGSIAVLQGAPETREYRPFRQDNNFYYLTGVETPGALLLLDGSRRRSILFVPPRNPDVERWEGPRLAPGSEASRATGMDEVLSVSEFDSELEKRRDGLKLLYLPRTPEETAAAGRDRALQFEKLRQDDPWDGGISREMSFERKLQAKLPSAEIRDLSEILDEMRRVKDAQEIGRLRTAGRIGALGIKEALRSVRPGMYEYQAAAVAQFLFLWQGASSYAFFPIVGSGPNSYVLHYSANSRRMEAGELVVMDFGPDYRYYASDITRTFPVSGKFTKEQTLVYQTVLDALEAAIAKTRPGATFAELGHTVREVLDRRGYAKYLNHAVSHYVGMSAHDVGSERPFEPGVVIAIEPGVYMPGSMGIRIEDTVLVTRDGCEVLTGDVPKEIAEIERLMAQEGIAGAIRN